MGVRMVEMPVARSANPLRALASGWRLYRWLKKERPTVLHVHTPVASMIGRFAGWLARVPLIVYTAHGFYFHDRMEEKQYRRHVRLERFFCRFQDALFCVSREDAQTAVRLKLSKRRNTFFVSNGVDPERFNRHRLSHEALAKCRDELGVPDGAPVIAIMGRMVREKGYIEFFQAARHLAPEFPQVRFLVIGDTVTSEHDSAKEEILRHAESRELKGRVHFTGLRRDIPELLAVATIFCLPTYREGMPVSILEAMAMELPVVTTNIRGCREEVLDGRTGFLVEPQDVEQLHGALRTLLRRPGVARRLGQAGRERVLKHFREDVLLDYQAALYDFLLDPAQHTPPPRPGEKEGERL